MTRHGANKCSGFPFCLSVDATSVDLAILTDHQAMSGVSKLRLAGRMRPSRAYNAARGDVAKDNVIYIFERFLNALVSTKNMFFEVSL